MTDDTMRGPAIRVVEAVTMPQYVMGSDGMGKCDVPDYITVRWVDRAVRAFWWRLSDG